jgi:2-oxo-3-hexenedioate decarboxylase
MSVPVDTTEIAATLAKARADRVAIGSFSAEIPEFDLAAAYAVQRKLRAEAGALVGWKLGVTSRAKQVQVGVNEPIRGFLAARDALDLGEPLPTGEHIQPRAEPEIVFVMGADLAGPAVTASGVLAATAGVAVGLEILDSRYRDYKFTMPDVVADNASAGRFVVGPPVPPGSTFLAGNTPYGIDLRLLGVLLELNGEVVGTAAGAAALGHPAASVAWLVRSLAEENQGLRAGDLVLSGGLTAAVPVRAGDVVTATADRLGSVELACQ